MSVLFLGPFAFPATHSPHLFSCILDFGHNVRKIPSSLPTLGPLHITGKERHRSHEFSSVFMLYITTSNPLSLAGKAPSLPFLTCIFPPPSISVPERGPVSCLLSHLFQSPKMQIPNLWINKDILKSLQLCPAQKNPNNLRTGMGPPATRRKAL